MQMLLDLHGILIYTMCVRLLAFAVVVNEVAVLEVAEGQRQHQTTDQAPDHILARPHPRLQHTKRGFIYIYFEVY